MDELLTIRDKSHENEVEYVFPGVSGQSLSQKYLAGFALPMPLPSVLMNDAVVVDNMEDSANMLKQTLDPIEMEIELLSQKAIQSGLIIESNDTIDTTTTINSTNSSTNSSSIGRGLSTAAVAVWKNHILIQRQRLQYLAQKFATV